MKIKIMDRIRIRFGMTDSGDYAAEQLGGSIGQGSAALRPVPDDGSSRTGRCRPRRLGAAGPSRGMGLAVRKMPKSRKLFGAKRPVVSRSEMISGK